MSESSYKWSWQQCQWKIKYLKLAYRRAKDTKAINDSKVTRCWSGCRRDSMPTRKNFLGWWCSPSHHWSQHLIPGTHPTLQIISLSSIYKWTGSRTPLQTCRAAAHLFSDLLNRTTDKTKKKKKKHYSIRHYISMFLLNVCSDKYRRICISLFLKC